MATVDVTVSSLVKAVLPAAGTCDAYFNSDGKDHDLTIGHENPGKCFLILDATQDKLHVVDVFQPDLELKRYDAFGKLLT